MRYIGVVPRGRGRPKAPAGGKITLLAAKAIAEAIANPDENSLFLGQSGVFAAIWYRDLRNAGTATDDAENAIRLHGIAAVLDRPEFPEVQRRAEGHLIELEHVRRLHAAGDTSWKEARRKLLRDLGLPESNSSVDRNLPAAPK